jgi:hypothetical protein
MSILIPESDYDHREAVDIEYGILYRSSRYKEFLQLFTPQREVSDPVAAAVISD